MVIDKRKLTALLVDKTGMSKQTVEEQLNELIQEVQDAADAGRDFIIEGFGTFTQRNDAAYFEADEVFQTEINQKYAGMKPIEIMSSFKESRAGMPAEMTKQASPAEESLKPKKKGKTQQAAGSPAFSQANSQKLTDRNIAKENANRPKKSVNDSFSQSEEPSAENVRKSTGQNETGTTGIFSIAIVVIIAILLAAWLCYNMGLFASENTTNSRSVTEGAVSSYKFQNENKMQEAAILSHNNRFQAEQMEANESVSPDNDFKSTDSNNALYGLKGALNSDAMDGYTIVIHSLRNESLALDTKNSVQEQDYRAIIMKEMVDGRFQWRVALGQFKTISEAQKAAQTLPAPYKSNHFITRM